MVVFFAHFFVGGGADAHRDTHSVFVDAVGDGGRLRVLVLIQIEHWQVERLLVTSRSLVAVHALRRPENVVVGALFTHEFLCWFFTLLICRFNG